MAVDSTRKAATLWGVPLKPVSLVTVGTPRMYGREFC